MQGQFEIGRNALMIHTPIRSNGDIDCVNEAGERKFPKLDYSKGFPDWWYLSRTDITVPSEHVQHGKRYAAEVKLSHFYEIDHYKNRLGVISFFMQDFEGEPSWPYLDKLICKWRLEEEAKRVSCGLPPAPVYKMCELYRGQSRSADDFEAPTQAVIVPTRAPLVAPPAIPINNFGGDPEEFRLPLALCQGDCDFTGDCAPGLICHRRDAFEAVPGCIGGESDETNTDYCVFDPYGQGYSTPTPAPTIAPSITARPTITPLNPQPLVDYGGTPPIGNMPLQICEGDCDKDEDCSFGLICFQRGSNETVPGCIGGELDSNKTDYCILDPYGSGYELRFTTLPTENPTSKVLDPTTSPTTNPTKQPTPPPNAFPTSAPSASPTGAPVPTVSPTYYPRPVGEPLRLKNLGWEPPVPLDECAGDCDVDEDCGPGLFCYQRNVAYEVVPGCAGGDEDPSLTDYCAFKPLPSDAPPVPAPTKTPTTAAPTNKGTPSPTGIPTVTATPTGFVGDLPNITIVGWSPKDPLDECEGDCDEDSDCLPGLICFQRNRANQEVPGCLGGSFDNTLTDYCIKDPNFVDEKIGDDVDITTASPTKKATSTPTVLPTMAPTKTSVGNSPTEPAGTDAPTDGTVVELLPIKDLGWTPPDELKPLGRCEGDCDIRQDCATGLDCYQRYLPNLAVPGCSGGELDDTLTDYCVPIEMMTQSSPAPAPKPVTLSPVAETQVPVDSRADETTNTTTPALPSLECRAYTSVNFLRMCKQDSCCVNPRSESDFCHESYVKLGNDTESACHHCCLELQGEAKAVGPDAVVNPEIPKLLECDTVDQPGRICRANSCCDATGSQNGFCQQQYSKYTQEEMESICVSLLNHLSPLFSCHSCTLPLLYISISTPLQWYCCHPSKTMDFDVRRSLAASPEDEESSTANKPKGLRQKKKHPQHDSKAAAKEFYKNQTLPVTENDRVTHDVNGRPVIVREENFEEKGTMDEEKYFEELIASYKRRALQQSIVENYDDVHWWPYEWFLKVGTEYYFRYEGTQTVPPCYDTAHWRAYKDPIRVAPHQMRELERLIAWRRGDQCQEDTAGKPTGNPNLVNVARPLQSYHRLHRMVFCECQDWPSKFPADRQWCRNWQNLAPEERLIASPYNFPSNGFDFL